MSTFATSIRKSPWLAAAIAMLFLAALFKALIAFELAPGNAKLRQTIDQLERAQRLSLQQGAAKPSRSDGWMDQLPLRSDISTFQAEQDRLAKLFKVWIIQLESTTQEKSTSQASSIAPVNATDFNAAVQGSYAGLRGWVTALMNSHPNLALKSLSIKRVGDDSAPLQAQVLLVWYAKDPN